MTRGPHPRDGRRQILNVTDSGFDHVMGELAPLLGLVFRASDGLSGEERAGALHYLGRVAAAYRAYLARSAPEEGRGTAASRGRARPRRARVPRAARGRGPRSDSS